MPSLAQAFGPNTRVVWRLFTETDGLEPHNVRGVAFLPDGSAWVQYQEPEGLTRVRLENGHLTVLEHRVKGHELFPEMPKGISGGPKDPPLDPGAIRGPED